MAATGIEQCHLFLPYQNVVLSVTDYGLGLTTITQTNLLKVGQRAERGNASQTENHQGHTH